MASAIDYQPSKAVRTYECDRQRDRKHADHSRNKRPRELKLHHTWRFGCYGSKLHMNGGTHRAGREKLSVQKVGFLHREAMNYISHVEDDSVENDWVADVPNSTGSQVDLGSIILCIAKPERKQCKKGGFARDFVMVQSVGRTQHLSDRISDDSDEDDWVVLSAPPTHRS